jgi:predicted RNase H-like HicB family nuclease
MARIVTLVLRLKLPYHRADWEVHPMTERELSAVVTREDEWYVAQCLEVDVASQGRTEEEALANLKEALELHFERPQSSAEPEIKRIRIRLHAA